MARVLLAWEAGDGLGHVGRLLPVARALRERGHEVVFAVRRLVPCATILADWPVLLRCSIAGTTPCRPPTAPRLEVGGRDGHPWHGAPGIENVQARAKAAGVPVQEVWRAALAGWDPSVR